jgi:hypothetical protein
MPGAIQFAAAPRLVEKTTYHASARIRLLKASCAIPFISNPENGEWLSN